MAYYPGCSLTESAVEYDTATRLVMERMGRNLEEIPGWTCCGATAAEAEDGLLALSLSARNIALAEASHPDGCDILVPCSACYLNLLTAFEETRTNRNTAAEVNAVLKAQGLSSLNHSARPRHLLDVLGTGGAEDLASGVQREFPGLTVAPYYGCQALRPYRIFDDPEHPVSMNPILEALGVETLEWGMEAKCCGASLMATKKEAALALVRELLLSAQGADAIVTVCPMCQMNLEAYQSQALKGTGADQVAVVYLPQLLGLGFGLSAKEVLMGKNLKVTGGFKRKLKETVTGPVAATP
jgi:heterodisulfide reductase subunit B